MSLLPSLKRCFIDLYAMYFAAHTFHWNVEGPLFVQLHELFQKIYEDTDDALDALAEHIRTLGVFAPSSLPEIASHTKDEGAPAAAEMVTRLRALNSNVSASTEDAIKEAEKEDRSGLANFLQERLDKHAKWDWILTASSKNRPSRVEVRYDKVAEHG